MHVAPTYPATWQGRSITNRLARLDLRGRAVSVVRRMSDGPGVLARLKALGQRWCTRIWKARSETQSPSALERHMEELVALRIAGQPRAALRWSPIELQQLIDELDDAPVTPAAFLAAVHAARQAEARAMLSESALLTRTDRALDGPALDRYIADTTQEIAAETELLTLARATRRASRDRAQRLVAIPGGLTR